MSRARATQSFEHAGQVVARGAELEIGRDLSAAEAREYIRLGRLVPVEDQAPAIERDRRVASRQTVKRGRRNAG